MHPILEHIYTIVSIVVSLLGIAVLYVAYIRVLRKDKTDVDWIRKIL